MTSPEGRWWKARQGLGDALGENQALARGHEIRTTRSDETVDLARQQGRAEAALELAKSKLDLATLHDRRARSAYEHAIKVAQFRGLAPEKAAPFTPDPGFAEAQAEFAAAKEELRKITNNVTVR